MTTDISAVAPPRPTRPATASGAPERAARPRIRGIDLARGFAIIGMFGAHILMTEDLGWDPSTWAAVVHGRSSILFATLAGVSVALMTGGARPYDGERLRDARTRLLVRAVLLLAIGSLVAMFGSIAVILEVYAILIAASVLFVRWRVRSLLIGAAVTAVAGAALVHVLSGLLYGWELMGDEGGVVGMTLGGTYPALIWLAFVLLGLAVGRLDLRSQRVRLRLLAAGLLLALAGYGGGWASTELNGDAGGPGDGSWESGSGWEEAEWEDEEDWEETPMVPSEELELDGMLCSPYGDGTVYCEPEGYDDGEDWEDGGWDDGWGGGVDLGNIVGDLPDVLTGAEPHSGTPFEVVGSSGVALAVLALCLLAPALVQRALYPVAAAGSMALTLYAAHAIGLKYSGDSWQFEHPTRLFLVFVAAALVLAVAWKRWLGQGPLERLLSNATYRANRATARQSAPVPAPVPVAAVPRQADGGQDGGAGPQDGEAGPGPGR